MRCKKCGTDNPDSASYCRNCGFELSAIRRNRDYSDGYDSDETVSSRETSGSSGTRNPGKAATFRKARELGDDRGGYNAGSGSDAGRKGNVNNRREFDRTGRDSDSPVRGGSDAAGYDRNILDRDSTERAGYGRDGYEHEIYGRGGSDYTGYGGEGYKRERYADDRSPYDTPFSSKVPAGYSAEPLSIWAYMGLSLLFGIPLAGFICLIVFSCGAVKNINLVNYARGLLLIEIIIMVLGFVMMYTYGLTLANLINSLVSSY